MFAMQRWYSDSDGWAFTVEYDEDLRQLRNLDFVPPVNKKTGARGRLSDRIKYIYLASGYESGDDYTEHAFIDSSLDSILDSIESFDCDWPDGCFDYVIIWRIPVSYLPSSATTVLRIFSVQDEDWIDFSIEKENEERFLEFDTMKLSLSNSVRISPRLTPKYDIKILENSIVAKMN